MQLVEYWPPVTALGMVSITFPCRRRVMPSATDEAKWKFCSTRTM